MPVMIQIRNVPDDVHRKLKARAAEAGMSLSAFLLRDITQKTQQPTMSEWLKRLRKMPPIVTKESSLESIKAIRGEKKR